MAWISEDWDKLGSFFSRGLSAYTSERQRRQESRWRQGQMDRESQRAEAYIATLNEQMEASQQRRAADARAAERLRTPVGEAWGGGPEDVPMGEMGAYSRWMEEQEPERGQMPVSATVREFFEEGLPTGITYEDFEELKPFLMEKRRADRKAALEAGRGGEGGAGAGGGYSGMPAAMLGQIQDVEERSRMQALMSFAQQDPELMAIVESATNIKTGEFDWRRVARALGEEGWQELEEAAQYSTDEWLLGKGIVTPGIQQRYEQRHYRGLGGVESPDEEEDRRAGTPSERKGMVPTGVGEGERAMTTAERKAYYLAEHPGLQQPAMAGLLADPQAIDVLALKELYSDQPATGFSALETMDWKNLDPSRQWAGWSGDIREEQTRQMQAARRKELERSRGRPPRRNAPRR